MGEDNIKSETESKQFETRGRYRYALKTKIDSAMTSGNGMLSFAELRESAPEILGINEDDTVFKMTKDNFLELWGGDAASHSVWMDAISDSEKFYRDNNYIGAEDLINQTGHARYNLMKSGGQAVMQEIDAKFNKDWAKFRGVALQDQKMVPGTDLQYYIDQNREKLNEQIQAGLKKGPLKEPEQLAEVELSEKRKIIREYLRLLEDALIIPE